MSCYCRMGKNKQYIHKRLKRHKSSEIGSVIERFILNIIHACNVKFGNRSCGLRLFPRSRVLWRYSFWKATQKTAGRPHINTGFMCLCIVLLWYLLMLLHIYTIPLSVKPNVQNKFTKCQEKEPGTTNLRVYLFFHPSQLFSLTISSSSDKQYGCW